MYWGYLGFGSVELSNAARLVKYAAEGAAPSDLIITPNVGDYTDLHAALGDAPYRTPLLDTPPWYDATNPDSAAFAGLLVLELTGFDGSTRERPVTEGLTDGGKPGRGRASSRTLGVSVLALAAGDAALDAGLGWLTGVLHPPCASASDSCRGIPVSLFSAAPVYCDQIPNLDVEQTVQSLISGAMTVPGPSLAYQDLYGAYLDPVCGEVTVTAQVQMVGDDAELSFRYVALDLVDSTGAVFGTSGPVLISILDGAGPDYEVIEVSVTVDPSPGSPADWQPILRWFSSATDIYVDGYDGGDSGDEDYDGIDGGGSEEEDDLVDGGTALTEAGPEYGGEIIIHTWTVARYPVLSTEDCLSELRRSYRNVVTSEGPTVVEEWADPDGTPFAAVVEWTWVATDPVAYGETMDLLRGLYVGALGIGSHDAVRVSRVSGDDVPLFVPPTGYSDIDGVAYGAGGWPTGTPFLLPGDRVLLGSQTDPAENGIYIYNGPGVFFTRADDMNGSWDTEVVCASVYINEGDDNGHFVFKTDVTPGGTLGVTPMPWVLGYGCGTPGYDDAVFYRAPGLQIGDNAEVDGGDTDCPAPSPVVILCGDDPTLPPIVAPPVAPSLPDAGMTAVTTYVRREIQIPPEQSPQPGGVLSVTITSLSTLEYRGIRVRLWADPDPDFGVTDECDWETEFYLTYLAPGQTVTINGPDHTVTTTCASGIDADHERNMRGPYGGPFTFPELRCGERYHLTIDVPSAADQGADEGDPVGVSVDVSVTRRGV